MGNPVLILTFNNLELTKRCVESVHNQDVATRILIVDNGSTDGTIDWLRTGESGAGWTENGNNDGVSKGWNQGLGAFFAWDVNPHVLVLNNDVELPTWFYSELLSYDVPFVTGVAVDQRPTIRPEKMPLNPHPDYSAFLIRREAWEKIGPFDERMKLYCSDCDHHVRGHRLGIQMMKANVPYLHINSQTLKRATPENRAIIETQANLDRATFQSMYGCLPGTKEYEALFGRGE